MPFPVYSVLMRDAPNLARPSDLHSMRMAAVFLTQLSTHLVPFGTSPQPAYTVVVLGLLCSAHVAAGFLLVMTDLGVLNLIIRGFRSFQHNANLPKANVAALPSVSLTLHLQPSVWP